ncbi:hypothetical protein [Polynucleobacter brandtiae]
MGLLARIARGQFVQLVPMLIYPGLVALDGDGAQHLMILFNTMNKDEPLVFYKCNKNDMVTLIGGGGGSLKSLRADSRSLEAICAF